MKRPIIAIDARYGLRAPRRGVGEYVYQLLTHLADIPRHYDVEVYGDQTAAGDVVRELSGAFAVHTISAPNFLAWEQWAFPKAAAHAQLWHGTANIGPWSKRVPLVLTVHDVIEWHRGTAFPSQISFRHQLSRLYRMNTLARQIGRAEHIFTVSNHAKADIAQTLHVNPQKITVTPLASKMRVIEEPFFPKKPYFLALGAIDPRKNVRGLIQAAKILPKPYTLQIVGVESRAQELYHHWLKEEGVMDRVVLKGMVSDRELSHLYREATGFIYLSYYEGFGLPVLEAMALGCPVIASNTTSIPDVVGDAGLLNGPNNLDHLHQNLLQLTDPELQISLAQKGLGRAREFSWTRTTQATHDVYNSLLFAQAFD